MKMNIGNVVQMKTCEGPLMCVANDATMTGSSLEFVQCCYWNTFTEAFVFVQMNSNILKVVDMPQEIDDPPTVPPAE